MLKKRRKILGFTLIELLVVISIIGFLSVVAMVAFKNARADARDKTRIANMQTIQKALDMYYDTNKKYPARYAYTGGTTSCGTSWCLLEQDLATFLKKLPRDPSGDIQTTYRCYYDSDTGDSNQTYGLMCRLENKANFYLVTNDGGYYNSATNGQYYEIGKQPSYCKDKYTGTNSNWWGSGSTVCVGGN